MSNRYRLFLSTSNLTTIYNLTSSRLLKALSLIFLETNWGVCCYCLVFFHAHLNDLHNYLILKWQQVKLNKITLGKLNWLGKLQLSWRTQECTRVQERGRQPRALGAFYRGNGVLVTSSLGNLRWVKRVYCTETKVSKQ